MAVSTCRRYALKRFRLLLNRANAPSLCFFAFPGNALACLKWLAALLLLAGPLNAQPFGDACRLIAESRPIWRAATSLARDEVRLTFIGHATFSIESPKGITIQTDYNDYVRAAGVPMIATMNKAHSTHYSLHPDPGILHVLHGWGEPSGAPARHDLALGDVRVRNVPTNIRSFAATEPNGNSIFIFEVAGLCIAHLGHLHHLLEPEQLRDIGRVDVLLAPVDGSYTLDQPGMIEVVKALSPALLIPMHYFNRFTLERFVNGLGKEWQVERHTSSEITLSRASLPAMPRILILPERYARDIDR